MKGRYLLVLAVVATALVLALPAVALAAEQHVTLDFAAGPHAVDFDHGVVDGAGADISVQYMDIGQWWDEWTFWCSEVPGAMYSYVYGNREAPSYDAITSWNDITHVCFSPGTWGSLELQTLVVRTDEGNFFKVHGVADGTYLTIYYDLIPPDPGAHALLGVGPYADFDTDTTSLVPEAGSDLGVGVSAEGFLCIWTFPQDSYAVGPLAAYETVTWQDIPSLVWTTEPLSFQTYPAWLDAVVRTGEGRYFKVSMGWHDACYNVFYQELLAPNDPPQLLTELGGFIAAPTAGTIGPAATKVLAAEVNLAAKALAQGHPRVAVALLKVLIVEVKVLPARMVSADARAEIIARASAIITAINQ